MELVQGSLEDTLTGLQIGGSSECLGRVLDAQRTLFHSQIDQLQKIVVTQCKLTGSNPLSQEMAAGALSIKIGKRPRDLLNPKAIKYMQSIFSIKDTISKKETREISALCGVTITQVREFFASQRSRVRKLVRLSREKAVKSNAGNAISNGYSSSTDHVTPISNQTCENHENDVDLRNVEECTQVPINSVQPVNAIQQANEASRESANINSVAGSFSCSPQEETIPGIDSDDQEFVENIFSLMRKEEAFSGQVKLMEWILQIRNSAVLQWFLAKGGVMILATWLGQAAFEEQTTVLLVIFKVLCHLPLHKALPAQMSAILQSVNKLRFYRTSDISNKARVLLSRWSKMFIRSQALKRPFSMNYPSDNHKEIIRKQRISEILSDESWLSKVDLPEDVLALAYEGSEDGRKSDRKSTLKLLPATCNDSSKKQSRSVSCPKTKERRKVLLVEQPDHKPAGRSVQVTRALPAKSSRPMSADDIQKAKMRAIFMQRKYGNTDTPANENHFQKAVNQKISIAAQANGRLFMPKLPKLERDEDKKFEVSAMKPSEAMHKMLVDSKPSLASGETRLSLASLDSKPCLTSQESLSEKLKNDHITWQMPAAVRISGLWSVGTGENSKEMEVQTARIRREKETFYVSADEIPANPKDPWDIEMDYDDSLTPEIPTEPPPDADRMDVVDGEPSVSPGVDKGSNVEDKQPAKALAPGVAGAPPPEPDLELLAVLLKNPELVFALTLGQGNNLTNTETVALLDVLKKSNGGLPGMLVNGSVGTTSKASESPTSLPSPTPPSERARMGWRSEHAPTVKDLWLQHQLPAGVSVATGPPAPVTANASPSPDSLPGAILVRSTVPLPAISGILSTARLPEIPHPPPSRLPGTQLQPISSPSLPHNAPPPMPFPQRVPKPEVVPPSKHLPVNASAPSLLQHQETVHLERMISRKLPSSPAAAAVSTVPPLLPTPPRVQPPLIPEPPVHSSLLPRWPSGAARGSREPVLGSWHGQPNGLLESPPPASAHNPHFSNDQRNVNIFAAAPIRMHSVLPTGQMAESNDLLDRSELEPWSPERSPLRGPEYPPMRGYPEQRRGGEYGRGDRRPERPRQNYVSGHRDRHRSGRRWRDRDRRP